MKTKVYKIYTISLLFIFLTSNAYADDSVLKNSGVMFDVRGNSKTIIQQSNNYKISNYEILVGAINPLKKSNDQENSDQKCTHLNNHLESEISLKIDSNIKGLRFDEKANWPLIINILLSKNDSFVNNLKELAQNYIGSNELGNVYLRLAKIKDINIVLDDEDNEHLYLVVEPGLFYKCKTDKTYPEDQYEGFSMQNVDTEHVINAGGAGFYKKSNGESGIAFQLSGSAYQSPQSHIILPITLTVYCTTDKSNNNCYIQSYTSSILESYHYLNAGTPGELTYTKFILFPSEGKRFGNHFFLSAPPVFGFPIGGVEFYEKKRFANKFTYQVKLDLDMLAKIETMIGLSYKEAFTIYANIDLVKAGYFPNQTFGNSKNSVEGKYDEKTLGVKANIMKSDTGTIRELNIDAGISITNGIWGHSYEHGLAGFHDEFPDVKNSRTKFVNFNLKF